MAPNKILVTDWFNKNTKKKKKKERSIYKIFALSFSVILQNSLLNNFGK